MDEAPNQPAGRPQVNSTYKPGPGKRLNNPLGDYSSYTYQFSLYMITPDAYEAFASGGRTNINALSSGPGGAFLIAQSGGINDAITKRAPGFKFDYYIDDVKIKQVVGGGKNGTQTATTEITFTILEPYGFSFITKLKESKQQLNALSSTPGYVDSKNASKQMFILGVRFLGYDAKGEVIKNTVGQYERYFDILFTKVQFKLEGRATTYNISAVTLPPQIAFSINKGMIDRGATPIGNTVGDVLRSLMNKLNLDQEDAVKSGDRSYANNYNIEFYGPDGTTIEKSSFVTAVDLDKAHWPYSKPPNDAAVNPNLEYRSNPEPNQRQISFKNDTPIVQAINQVITQSNYCLDALKVAYTNVNQPDQATDSVEEKKNKNIKIAKWVSVSAKVANARWDTQIKDFAYDITYVVQSYEVPIIVSPFVTQTAKYYGPVKTYDYWYTGKNSEVIRYEQTLNNTYFISAYGLSGTSSAAAFGGTQAQIPVQPDKVNDVSRSLAQNTSPLPQNTFVNSIIDPAAYATAKVEILGDPDWLMQDSPPGETSTSTVSFDPFYGPDGYAINPNAGQVFIEINFKEAVDYDNGSGVLQINDRILFWDYPPDILSVVKGISYQVIGVVSSFKGGKFTQELTCIINTFGMKDGYTADKQRESQGSAPTSNGSTSSGTGLVPEAPVITGNPSLRTPSAVPITPTPATGGFFQLTNDPDQSPPKPAGWNFAG